MNATVRIAVEAKIAAITADPLGWARENNEAFLATLGSMSQHAIPMTDEQLLTTAADHLDRARKLLITAGPAIPSMPIDTARLGRANERTHDAIDNLKS